MATTQCFCDAFTRYMCQVHTAAVRYARRGRVVSITQTLGSDHVRSFFAVPMPWDKKRKAKEEDELGLMRKFGNTASVLDGPLALPEDSQLIKWLEAASAALPREGLQKEEFQKWLTAGEQEASALARDKMGAFQREDWVVEGSADAKEVQLALHYTTLAHLFAELRKNKAVFTPHVPGETVVEGVPDKVLATIRAHVNGTFEDRLKGFWSLVDEQGDGLLPQQNMEDAVYACLEPPLLTVSMTYPTLPILQKQHKKPFIKFVKNYMRDQADYSTKLRCIFAWAEKQGDLPTNMRVGFDEYMKAANENFPEVHKLGSSSMELYSRVRAQQFAQKDDDRETFRLGIIFYIVLTATDVYVSGL